MKALSVVICALLAPMCDAVPSEFLRRRNDTVIDPTNQKSYPIFGTPDLYTSSPPFYPSPEGGRLENTWQDAYTRARQIVDTLNIAEKVNITTGTAIGRCSGNTGFVHGAGLEFSDGFCMNDGPLGVRGPDLVTAFPPGLTVASTFNRTLLRDRGIAIGAEFKGKGIDIMLGPVSGPIGYKALDGRSWEGFGADPYLQGISIKETVEGIQSQNVIAVAKHFIGNEQEHYRLQPEETPAGGETVVSISSNIDDRAMHEIFLWPFAEAVKAGTASIMCSYNKLNGSDACQNSYSLNNLLKSELGFQGFVISDWYATKSGAASALAGLDMSMPGNNILGGTFWGSNLTQAVLNGTIPEERLDDMTTRILASYFFVGVNHTGPNYSENTKAKYDSEYDSAFLTEVITQGQQILVNEDVDVRTEFSYEVSLQSALEGIALVKNVNNALPIKKENGIKKIAILGQGAIAPEDGFNCNNLLSCTGGAPVTGYGSGAGSPSFFIPPTDGVGRRCIEEKIQYDVVPDSFNFTYPSAKAQFSDAAIVFAFALAGEAVATVAGNYGDRNNASLWYNADELIANISSVNNNTIVVIATPGPINVESFVDNENVTAILISSFLGQEGGSAINKVLFGDYNPSGRLAFTIAKNDKDYIPVIYNTTSLTPQDDFTNSIFFDYRYFDYYNITPRYEFGYGLSYSNFTFSDLEVSEIAIPQETLTQTMSYLPTFVFKEDDMNPEDYLFPSNFTKIKGFVYPYIESADVNTTGTYPYPEGYSTDQHSSPPLAGGGLGGNPQLWDIAYNVSATLTNGGPYDGSYVAQLYVGFPKSSQFPTPPRQLRGFDKISLPVGQSGEVIFSLSRKDLSVWDVVSQSWIVQRGEYTIFVGSSSRNLELVDQITIA